MPASASFSYQGNVALKIDGSGSNLSTEHDGKQTEAVGSGNRIQGSPLLSLEKQQWQLLISSEIS